MPNLEGKTLLNRFQVLESLGRGGMAEVYKVWDKERSVDLAMKVLHEELAIDRVFVRRFKREAQTLAKLQHPSIVRFYGFEQDDDLAFMLLDYVEGRSLKRLIYDHGGPLPLDTILTISQRVLSALGYAHRQGFVHADIKPGNILIDDKGRAHVSDFGIARMTDAATMTMAGAGTPAYMAPETIRGEAPTPAVDIYGWGVVLFEMLTGGERPFTGEQATVEGSTGTKVRWEHLNLEPPSPRKWNPAVTPEMEAVVLRCLAKEPDARFASAQDFQGVFEKALGQMHYEEGIEDVDRPIERVKAPLVEGNLHTQEPNAVPAASKSQSSKTLAVARQVVGVWFQQRTIIPRPALIWTAVLVPLLIVTIAMVVYFRNERANRIRSYFEQAQAAIERAQQNENPEAARQDWDDAQGWVILAEEYGQTDESQQLHQLIQESLDEMDKVVRLELTPIISSGDLGFDANISALAASSTGLYIYDANTQRILHAWGAPERGYELDTTFECLNGPGSHADVGPLVDIVIQSAPGEGVVGIDRDGTLLYCAPDQQPALGWLAPPDGGWGYIQAVDSRGDQLYILDTTRDSIWIYDAQSGLFTGTPAYYLTEEVRDLADAIDLAIMQDGLVILYAGGQIDICWRIAEGTPARGQGFNFDCEESPQFQDTRPGYEGSSQIPGSRPITVSYSPPPEPALLFLDNDLNRIFQYSMRLLFRFQYVPLEELGTSISAIAVGPPRIIFIAVGPSVYYAVP